MASDPRQLAAVEDVLAWLENSLRETRAQVLRLEHGLEQAEDRIADLTGKVHSAEDGSAAISRRIGEFASLGAQVEHLRQIASQTEENVRDSERRVGESMRVQQQESERHRQELNGALRRIDLLERTVEGWGARFENVETTIGRVQEALTIVRQRTDEVDRRQETAESHITRNAESLKHYEREMGRIEVENEALERTGNLLMERLQAFGEGMKRLEQQSDAIAADVTAQHDIFERIDLLRAELHRVEDRIAAAETVRDLDHQEIDDHQRLISLLDGKDHGFADRLSMLQGELAAYQEIIGEQFSRLHQTLDRQKRHQIEELHRELRDLQVNAFRPAEELAAGDTPEERRPPAGA